MNIPHNEQKHNNNQTSLQQIGNLAYQQGKSATYYDSINSLTPPNNQYTLLYPDLVQELFDFALHNSNSSKNNAFFLRNINVNNIKSSSLDSSLSPRDILFFLQIVSLYQLELSKGNTSIIYPSLRLAKLLGVDASCDVVCTVSNSNDSSNTSHSSNTSNASNKRATILKMTSKLEALGLLKVFRGKRKNGMDMTNKLIPILPDRLHARLKDFPSNLKVSDSSKLDHESNLEHILRTKLFVPIELEFMKSLFKNDLPSKYKLFFLNCIMSAYRNFRQNSSSLAAGNTLDASNMFSFSSTSPELMKKNNISYSTLKRIFKYIKQQGDNFFLQVEHKYTKSDDIDSNRYDKSIFVISINPLLFPISCISYIKQSQTEGVANFDYGEVRDKVLPIIPDTYQGFAAKGSKKQPRRVKKTAHNNKEEIIKNKYSRNIDYIDENCENLENPAIGNPPNIYTSPCSETLETLPKTQNTVKNYKEEFLEEELCSSSSKFYNNSSFLDVSSSRKGRNISKQQEIQKKEQKEEWQELRQFYPLSDKDTSLLNSRANREFSNNFVNQLLLKLYIKYPEKRFKNRFTFLSYMEKILKNEKHQGPLVNHTSFRFSCNVDTEEKIILEYERYLNQIEDSLDTSKEMQLKKKIAGRFSTEVAYKILTKVKFKLNQDNSFITALIPNQLALSERQKAYLSEQLEAVYGVNGYYITAAGYENVNHEDVGYSEDGELKGERKEEIGKPHSKIKESDIITNSEDIGILDIGMELDKIEENTVWDQIRNGLREELGEAIDTVWFSKAVVSEDKETKTLTLTMPTRFMADWIKNNYSHVIRRLARRDRDRNVEYCWNANT